MSKKEKAWYDDRTTSIEKQLRKMDTPVNQRSYFKGLALDSKIITLVEDIIDNDVISFLVKSFLSHQMVLPKTCASR